MSARSAERALASFGGGCFWCMEAPFDKISGVESVYPGYMGGHVENPSYEQVCQGTTGHVEVVQITYDPSQLSYEELLDIFWCNINPSQADGQFADIGSQYQSVIFYHDDDQKKQAEDSKRRLEASQRFAAPIVTVVRPATQFYRAESYHCQYYLKNPAHYQSYRQGSGRSAFLKKNWESR